MSEELEAFSAFLVGLLGTCSGAAFTELGLAIVVAPLSGRESSMLSDFISSRHSLSELDQVALDFTLWPKEVAIMSH